MDVYVDYIDYLTQRTHTITYNSSFVIKYVNQLHLRHRYPERECVFARPGLLHPYELPATTIAPGPGAGFKRREFSETDFERDESTGADFRH